MFVVFFCCLFVVSCLLLFVFVRLATHPAIYFNVLENSEMIFLAVVSVFHFLDAARGIATVLRSYHYVSSKTKLFDLSPIRSDIALNDAKNYVVRTNLFSFVFCCPLYRVSLNPSYHSFFTAPRKCH